MEYKFLYPDGEDFIEVSNLFYSKVKYRLGSFQLHQACKRLYNAVSLVFTNYRPKSHKLKELGALVKEFSRELANVFPQNTEFEARYNSNYVVTKEELAYMLERTEIMKEVTAPHLYRKNKPIRRFDQAGIANKINSIFSLMGEID